MSQLMPPRRPSSRLRLRVRSADDLTDPEFDEADQNDPILPWYAAGLVAGFASAVAGWLIVTAVVVIGWLSARSGALGDALNAGTQFWLLANGAGLSLAGQQWTLTPLLLTLLLGVVVAVAAGLAAQQAQRGNARNGVELTHENVRQSVRNVTLVTAVGYVVTVTVTAAVAGTSTQITRALIASTVLGVIGAYLGSAKSFDYRPSDAWPAWARAVPAAIKAALAVMIATGAAVVACGVLLRRERVTVLAAELGADAGSGFLLLVAQLLFLPNFILWGGSWALGAGFRVGADSVVAPAATELGLMPAIPILGALPGQGVGTRWMLAWMVSGMLAGVAAAAIVMRRRPRARFDETGLVGGLSGVLASLVYTALSALSTGGLGTGRLSVMGPRLLELLVLSGALMGLSGMAVGLIWGLVRRPLAEQATLPAWEDDDLLDFDEDATITLDVDDGETATDEEETEAIPDEASADDPHQPVDGEPVEADDEETVVVDDTSDAAPAPRTGSHPATTASAKNRWWRFGRS